MRGADREFIEKRDFSTVLLTQPFSVPFFLEHLDGTSLRACRLMKNPGVFNLSSQTGQSDCSSLCVPHDPECGMCLKAESSNVDHTDEILTKGLLAILDRPLVSSQSLVDVLLFSHEQRHVSLSGLLLTKPEIEQGLELEDERRHQ